jgi:uncharacterized protein with ParB-like and HNH nuclease domain
VKEIDGKGKTIRELLNGRRYYVDYYQRDYKWQTKQVRELIEDLTSEFLGNYDPKHGRKAVAKYGHYFLGAIVISDKQGDRFIVDGQQRLTTLTLLLIYLHRRQEGFPSRVKLEDLIFSEKFGEKEFNISVEERSAIMGALYNDGQVDENGQPERVRNIINRYTDIKELFPDEVNDAAIPFFADWLIENVHLVEITAQSDDDAYRAKIATMLAMYGSSRSAPSPPMGRKRTPTLSGPGFELNTLRQSASARREPSRETLKGLALSFTGG